MTQKALKDAQRQGTVVVGTKLRSGDGKCKTEKHVAVPQKSTRMDYKGHPMWEIKGTLFAAGELNEATKDHG